MHLLDMRIIDPASVFAVVWNSIPVSIAFGLAHSFLVLQKDALEFSSVDIFWSWKELRDSPQKPSNGSHIKAVDQLAKGILWLADGERESDLKSPLPSFFNYFCGKMESFMSHCSQPYRRPCIMTRLALSVYY